MRKDPNIRSPEERYGGEGHAGDDPFAGERAGKKDLPADPSIEVPDASVQDLIQQPDSRPEKLQVEPHERGTERRSGTESAEANR